MDRSSISSRLVIVALLFGSALAIVPQGANGNGTTGTVSGRVLDSMTDAPIEGAYVILDGNTSIWRTGPNGDYTLPVVPFGNHTVRVYQTGYRPASAEIRLNVSSLSLDFHLQLAPVPTKGGIAGEVTVEGEIAGYDADDAMVVIRSLDVPGTEGSVVDVEGDGNTGHYFSSIPPGNYSVQGFMIGHHPSDPASVNVLVGNVTRLDIGLVWSGQFGTFLSGRVLDASTSMPVPNATVVVHCMEDSSTLTTTTDGDGEYGIADPEAGNYTVVAMVHGYNSSSAVGEVVVGSISTLDVPLIPVDEGSENRRTVWGFVHAGGSPSGTAWAFNDMMGVTTTDMFRVKGLYVFDGFYDEGTHTLWAWGVGFHCVSSIVDLSVGSLIRRDLYLGAGMKYGESGSVLLVKVTDGSGPGAGLNGASVTVSRTDTFLGSVLSSTTIDIPPASSVGVMFPIEPASSYDVRAALPGHVLSSFEGWPYDEVQPPGGKLMVLGNRVNLLTVRMDPSPGETGANCTIWGFAMKDMLGGMPVPDATVFLHNGTGSLSATDVTGRYELRTSPGAVELMAVYPGAYDHAAYDHSTGAWWVGNFAGQMSAGEMRRIDLVFKQRGSELSTMAGRVIDRATGSPLAGFDVHARTAATSLPVVTTGPTGLFQFTPLTDLERAWTIYGGLPGHEVVRVDRKVLPSGPTTTGTEFPLQVTVPYSSIVWFDLYVNRSAPDGSNRSIIWGYVHETDLSGPLVHGAIVPMEPSPGWYGSSDEHGRYSYEVQPGSYLLFPLVPGLSSALSYDHATGVWAIGSWSGTLTVGEERHVDLIVKRGGNGTSTIAGRVLTLTERSPVQGFRVKARTDATLMPSVPTWSGFFVLGPLSDLDDAWVLDGEGRGYNVSYVEHRLLPSADVVRSSSLPISFLVPTSSVLWVDIFVNRTLTVREGELFGKVVELYSLGPSAGARVTARPALDETKVVGAVLTGSDGTFELALPEGDYIIDASKDGFIGQSVPVSVGGGGSATIRLQLLPEGMEQGKGIVTIFRFVDSGKGSPVRDLSVQIAGLGSFSTDAQGIVRTELPGAANYTVTVSGSIEWIEEAGSDNVTFNPDGTLSLVPGSDYTFRMRPYVEGSSEEKAGLSDPVVIGLVAGIVISLVVGVIVGLLASRRSREVMYFEE